MPSEDSEFREIVAKIRADQGIIDEPERSFRIWWNYAIKEFRVEMLDGWPYTGGIVVAAKAYDDLKNKNYRIERSLIYAAEQIEVLTRRLEKIAEEEEKSSAI